MACVWFTVAFWSLHSKARSLTTQTQCVKRAVDTDRPLTTCLCSCYREDGSHPDCCQVRCHGHGADGDGGKLAWLQHDPSPLTDCLDLGESVGKKLKRICASEVKKNLLLNQHNKKRFLLKMHTLFTAGYLRSGWHPKLLSFLSFTSAKLWLLLAVDGPAGSHQLGRISELFCMWVALWDDKTRKKKYNMQRFCFEPQFLNYTFCQSQ